MTWATAEAIEALKQKAQDWAKTVVVLYKTPVPVDMLPRKQALLQRANIIRKAIVAILGPIDTLKDIQLGFLPVIAAVAVAAAVTAVTYWLTDYGKFRLEVDAAKNVNEQVNYLVSQGIPAADAKAIAAGATTDKSWFEKLVGDPQKLLLPGLAMLLVFWFVKDRFNKRVSHD